MGEISLNSSGVVLHVNSSYDVEVATDRGSVFVSETGTLYFGENGWESECLGINVIILSSGVRFKVKIEKSDQTIYEEEVWKSGGSAMRMYDVTGYGPGAYHVTVMKKRGGGWSIVHEEDVKIEWPSGTPVVTVNA